ncbi:hypothetical protein ACQUEW_00035 [Enterococcus casseliflavus]
MYKDTFEVIILRVYKSVRLASVTSVWVDKLITLKQEQLETEINNGLIENAENSLLRDFPFLNGISRNISFKVSFSSIVEMCYRNTADYSNDDWDKLSQELEKMNFKVDNETTTPKLYLDDDIWNGLERYQRQLMGENNKRSLRLSYIIKLVIFAGWKQYHN